MPTTLHNADLIPSDDDDDNDGDDDDRDVTDIMKNSEFRIFELY